MIGRKNRKFKQYLSLILALLLLVSVVPKPIRAETEGPTVEAKQAIDYDKAPKAKDKISEEVKKDMQSGDAVEIIVYMKDKLDSTAFAEEKLAKHSQTMSNYDAKLQVRRDLVLALKDQSHKTQFSLRKLLEKSDKQVRDFHSFFIANVAYMKVDAELIEEIAALPEVEKITKNSTYYLDEYIVEDSVTTLEEENLWSLNMVHAPETWGLGIDGTGAVVGLLDSGADLTHPALHDNWRGFQEGNEEEEPSYDATYSWYDTVANEPLPIDSDTHGTHVTGTMVGCDKEEGITIGVAPGAKWICARVFDERGSTTDFNLLDAAEWMLAPGGNADMAPDAVNNSWGGGSTPDDWYIQAVDNYIAADIVPVFSAGNQRQGEPLPQPGSISNPAHYTDVVAVAAIDQNKLRASFSKRGPSPYTDNWKPDISAPGVGITSSMSGGTYGGMSGTSMASPHITGSIALMRSANKSLSVEQIKNMLFQNTEPLTDNDPNAQTSPNHDYGYGLVNVYDTIVPVVGGVGTFTGKVLCEGEDSELPTVSHEQSVFEIYIGSTIPVEVYVSDDTSIIDVSLMIKPEGENWKSLEMTQVDGNYKEGTYVGNIMPSDMGSGDFQYKIVVEDFVGNKVEAGPYDVVLHFGVKPGEYFESFEGSADGWKMDDLWQIGSPSYPGEPEVPHGEQYIGTAIGGIYGDNEDAYLISVPIDMRDTSEASVRFLHWYSLGYWAGDYGYIYITDDFGQTLNEISTYEIKSDGWIGEVIDISEYANSENPIYVIFHFVSNEYTSDIGWYIDQFSVEAKDTTPPDAPYNLTARASLESIELNWDFDMVPDFEEFYVYRSEKAGQEGEYIGRSSTNTYFDSYTNGIEDDTDYYYTVKAVDISGNISSGSNQVSVRKAEVNTIVAWEFEDNDGDFALGQDFGSEGNDWEWGEVAIGHGPGSALTGSNVWATGLDKDYGANRKAYLRTPEISIPADGASFLSMNHWFHFERISNAGEKWDYGQIHAKNINSDTWINITPEDDYDIPGEGKFGGPVGSNTPGPENWRFDQVGLDQFAGQTIEIRFYYNTDDVGYRSGWFINNVKIVNVPSTSAMKDNSYYLTSVKERQEKIAGFSIDLTKIGLPSEQNLNYHNVSLGNIPALNARVSVVETGQSVMSNNRTAEYRMMHLASDEAEKWTLKAEAYGYLPEYFETSLADGETVTHDFVLTQKSRGNISGQVFDRYSHDPAPNAEVSVVEDPNIEPVIANENGEFTIEGVYEGKYTLHAIAENFESGTASVNVVANETSTCDIPLKRFIGVPGEISYDDGTAENATVLIKPGGGIGMRFTPEQYGKLMNASFYFWQDDWPEPGGNEIGFGVFVKDGMGYKQIGATKVVDDIVRGDWYTIDLSDLNFATDEDFYVTTIQTQDGDHSPGHGLDESAAEEASDRSYFYSDGSFADFPSQDYSQYAAMIRCTLMYSADTPMITNLDEVTYTNEDTIDVEGSVIYDQGQVLVYANDTVVDVIEPEELIDNTFTTTVNLQEEETYIKAALKVGEKETEPSPDKLVIKDQIAPDLIVSEPYDGEQINVELVHVKGKVTDKYFDKLTINGLEIEVDEDGNYDHKLILEEGENPIEVYAVDKAGNETYENLSVFVKTSGDVTIRDMRPAKDLTVKPGDTVDVSFRAPEGGNASYTIIRPTVKLSSNLSTDMEEIEPCYYKATWMAGNYEFEDAVVRFYYTDAYGNVAKAKAPGKITVSKPDVIERVDGSNRYDTAAKMSQHMYDQAETVILTSGVNFPDTLVGGAYAEEIDAPILLSKPDKLPLETAEEITRLGASEVRILGGELAINAAVEAELSDLGLEIERIYGSNRYSTAVEVSERARSADSKHIFLVSGVRYEDALSIVPVAAQQNDGILLTKPDVLPAESKAALSAWGTESITIMGGPLAVSDEVEQELKDLGYIVTRDYGSNAYATNISVARNYFHDVTKVIGASGADFADAMVSASFAAKKDRPIILLDPEGLRDDTIRYFETEPVEHVLLMGGELAIPSVIEYYLRGLIEQ